MVAYVCEQVGVDDTSALAGYMARRPTRFEHAREITAAYDYREFSTVEKELARWLADRAWTTDEGPTALFDGAVVWLRARLVLLLGGPVGRWYAHRVRTRLGRTRTAGR